MPSNTPARHPLTAATAPSANPAGDKRNAPAPAPERGPALRFAVTFDDMRQNSYGITQAAERQHGLRLQILSPRKIRFDGDAAGQLSFCEFAVLPPLSWIINVLEESVGVSPAPFAVTLAFAAQAGSPGSAFIDNSDPRLPATRLGGCTLTPLLRNMLESHPAQLPFLAQLQGRFRSGDYGKVPPVRQQKNQEARAANQGEVLGIYPGNDPTSQPVLLAQKLPYEQGPCLMFQSEKRHPFSGKIGIPRR